MDKKHNNIKVVETKTSSLYDRVSKFKKEKTIRSENLKVLFETTCFSCLFIVCVMVDSF